MDEKEVTPMGEGMGDMGVKMPAGENQDMPEMPKPMPEAPEAPMDTPMA